MGEDEAAALFSVLSVLTVGHGTATEQELGDLLVAAGIELVVDVRIAPGSRRQPHVNREQLQRWLPERGIGYRWEPRLGGFRKAAADSPDTALRNASFRGYAAHMRSTDFLAAIDDLLADARTARTAIMCSESVWWRCHRRLIADFLVLRRGVGVRHLMPDGRLAEHRPTEGVRLVGTELVYDAAAP